MTEETPAIRSKTFDAQRFPDLDNMQSVTLRQSQRVSKVAKFSAIRDRHTGEIHHHALSIQTFRRKAGEELYEKAHSVSLSSEGEDEIGRLFEFLKSVRGEAEAPIAPRELENAELLELLQNRAAQNPEFLLETFATLQSILTNYFAPKSDGSA